MLGAFQGEGTSKWNRGKKKPKRDDSDKNLFEIIQSQKITSAPTTQVFSTKFKKAQTLKTRDVQYNQILENIRKRQRKQKQEQKNLDEFGYPSGKQTLLMDSERAKITESYYVDPYRKVAVGWDKDLLAEFKSEGRGRKTASSLKPQPELMWMLYLKEGLRNMSRGQLMPALKNFTLSISEEETFEPYIYRSKCLLGLGDARDALEDASKSLELLELHKQKIEERGFLSPHEQKIIIILKAKALYGKAEAYYDLSEFEKALIYYHRCLNLRPDLKWRFEDDIVKSTNAILNSVGPRCFKTPFLNMVVSDMKHESSKSMLKCTKKVQNVTKAISEPRGTMHFKDEKTKKKRIRVCTGIKRSRKAFRTSHDAALGRLCVDWGFVEEFAEEMSTFSSKATQPAQEALTYLEHRREFWKNQNPVNHRKNLGRRELRI